jgi:hypothetical protein
MAKKPIIGIEKARADPEEFWKLAYRIGLISKEMANKHIDIERACRAKSDTSRRSPRGKRESLGKGRISKKSWRSLPQAKSTMLL